ncbi:MAG: LysM peptidoglycan-binding domain-containing protein [Gammaproteobacteria bacterium]|nr:LysM peptidoglycan-binding domain-containing protein [Gammaproteobacteria bacterium]MCP4831882.1 LysM peptidoglycan-binding domain-containing protein [Gammaproteobacteria bacterium]MCP4929817.1 LysM peptidoglycan-binding domain-containing protein [Gammaproteobacteria bacterium]
MNICYKFAGKGTALHSLIFTALLVMTMGFVTAQTNDQTKLNPAHPETYTVVKDDTLWDISAMFLKDPWYWPEIWYVNPQVANPHLIYPGDILKLVYIDGQPRIEVTRGGGEDRLSPRIRVSDLDNPITAIPFKDIQPFLSGGMILDKKEADALPYIVALRDHLVAGAGHEVYVRGLDSGESLGNEYLVLNIDEELEDPKTGEVLGYEVLYIGTGELRAKGDPDTIFLTKTNREAIRGDRIRPADLTLPMNFFPSAPKEAIDGQIISVVDGLSRIGQYQMVIINRGTNQGLEAGNVLSVWQMGRTVRDNINNRGVLKGSISTSGYGSGGKKVTLPQNHAGNVMIVKAYAKISYALVMQAELEMQVHDYVRNP